MTQTGNFTLQFNQQGPLDKVVQCVNAGLTAAVQVMAARAVENMGRDHNPSLPGEFPGIVTGHLRRSIAYASPEALGVNLQAAFGTGTDYGKFLEFGTKDMAPRPWILRSAMEAEQAAMRRATAAANRKAAELGLK